MMALRTHTYRHPTVGPNKIDVGLRDGSHPDLIKCSGKKGSEGASKSHGATTGDTSQCHAHLHHKEGESEHSWSPLPLLFPSVECMLLKITYPLCPLTLPYLSSSHMGKPQTWQIHCVPWTLPEMRGTEVLDPFLQIQAGEPRTLKATLQSLWLSFPLSSSPASVRSPHPAESHPSPVFSRGSLTMQLSPPLPCHLSFSLTFPLSSCFRSCTSSMFSFTGKPCMLPHFPFSAHSPSSRPPSPWGTWNLPNARGHLSSSASHLTSEEHLALGNACLTGCCCSLPDWICQVVHLD